MTFSAKSSSLAPLIALFVGCRSAPETFHDALTSLLEENQYSLYTPFRTEDGPGTIFVLAANNQGRNAEFTLSTPAQTFDDRVDPQKLLTSKDVAFGEKLSKDFSLGGSAGLSLLSLGIDSSALADYAETITLTFGTPQRAVVLSESALTAHKSDIRDSTLEALRFHKSRGSLANAYFVCETLEIKSLTAKVTIKKDMSGKVTLDQIRRLTKANVQVKEDSASTFELSFATPMFIGYKASSIPDSIISSAVSAQGIRYEVVSARTLNKMKGG